MYVSAWKRAALCLACLGLILPQPALMAAETQTRSKDISLTTGGTLAGTVVDANGQAIANTSVKVKFRGFTVATTKSDATGRFAVCGLRGGVHEICTAGGSTVNRFWTKGNAPLAARSTAIVVAGPEVVRSQGGLPEGSDLLIGGLLVGGVIAAIIAAAEDDDDRPASP